MFFHGLNFISKLPFRPNKKFAVFLLTRPDLNFSSNPRNFIDPLSKTILICSKNSEHSAKIYAILDVCRGSMDTGNKAFVQFNENSHNFV
jgi:hypothetical protein